MRQNGFDCHMPVTQQQNASHMPVMDFDSLTKCLLKSGILSSRDFWGNSGRFFCDDRVMIVVMIKLTFGALEAQSPFWACVLLANLAMASAQFSSIVCAYSFVDKCHVGSRHATWSMLHGACIAQCFAQCLAPCVLSLCYSSVLTQIVCICLFL